MPFRGVAGHRSLLTLLARAIARDTLPPSLIFAGPAGVGKRRVADAVAEAFNCSKPAVGAGFDIDACGACASCRRIARNVHPDILVVEPGESGSIKIEQTRDAIDRTAFRPFEGRKRVIIIDDAEAMVDASQNALLKTLEEPPQATVLILVSSIPGALLPTVRSRCPVLRFGALTPAEVADVLVRYHGYALEEARAAAADADGSPGVALQVRSVDLTEARAAARRLLEQTGVGVAPRQRLQAAEAVKGKGTGADERNRLAACLRMLTSLLRDIAIISSGAEPRLLANSDLERELRALAQAFDEERARRAFVAADEALGALERNASPKLVADWLVLQL
jgi:DNA polymerase III subunit delta'